MLRKIPASVLRSTAEKGENEVRRRTGLVVQALTVALLLAGLQGLVFG